MSIMLSVLWLKTAFDFFKFLLIFQLWAMQLFTMWCFNILWLLDLFIITLYFMCRQLNLKRSVRRNCFQLQFINDDISRFVHFIKVKLLLTEGFRVVWMPSTILTVFLDSARFNSMLKAMCLFEYLTSILFVILCTCIIATVWKPSYILKSAIFN